MSEFERPLPSFRLVQTHHGDDLQAVAHRELGNANRWPELVWFNNLTYPYLTDDEARVGPGVILTGSLIKVPAPRGVVTEDAETGQVYERDCELVDKQLVDDGNGDFAVVAGVANLSQQLRHRIVTPKGQARRNPEYGCEVWGILGKVTGPLAAALGSRYVKAALNSDYRVATVRSAVAEVSGDSIKVTATAEAIAGSAVDLVAEG